MRMDVTGAGIFFRCCHQLIFQEIFKWFISQSVAPRGIRMLSRRGQGRAVGVGNTGFRRRLMHMASWYQSVQDERRYVMLSGFEKIIEQRIRKAQQDGAFNHLEGAGKPLVFEDDRHIPEELRLAYKILKNADCVPPEIELKKEILKTEEMLAGMQDTRARYNTLKKLNFLIMKLNSLRKGSAAFDMPQHYELKLVERFCPSSSNSDT